MSAWCQSATLPPHHPIAWCGRAAAIRVMVRLWNIGAVKNWPHSALTFAAFMIGHHFPISAF
jgi:hypothetical protein